MTEDITPQVLVQIRQDIAALGDRVDRDITQLGARIDRDMAVLRDDLTQAMQRGFAHTNEQLSSMIALMGVLAKNDDRLEHRIEAIEAKLAEPG